MTPDEEDVLRVHGFKRSALGDNCPMWLKKFAAMQVLPTPVYTLRSDECCEPFKDRSPVLGTNYLKLVWFVPKTGPQYYCTR